MREAVDDGIVSVKGVGVLIVGGGIAGQTLAVALKRHGIAAEIVEIKPDFAILGAGMYMQGNALRALLDIDVTDDIVQAGFAAAGDSSLIADRHGTPVAELSYPRIAGPTVPAIVPIRRQALHDVLQAAVQRHHVRQRLGVTVETIEDDPQARDVHVRFSDGTEGRFGLVVGADGIRSKVRRLCFGLLEPTYTGFANWRTILPRPETLTRPTWMIGGGLSMGLMPISQDCMYLAGVTREPGNPWYPEADLPRLMKTKFCDFGGMATMLIETIHAGSKIVYTPIEEVHQPAPWFKGRVVLVGDAAHASTPFWAQGASMAIEDVIVLARLLAETQDAPSILPTWQKRRYERCLWVQQSSMRAGEMRHPTDPDIERTVLSQIPLRAPGDIAAQYARLAEPI